MLKYLKTLNSSNHPTEIFSFISPAGEDATSGVKAGTVISLTFGEVSPVYTPQTPLYLAITSKSYTKTDYVKCIKLTSGMVLEAEIEADVDLSNFHVGAICDLVEDMHSKGAFLTRDGYENFEIIDNSNVENGTVTVVVL